MEYDSYQIECMSLDDLRDYLMSTDRYSIDFASALLCVIAKLQRITK